MFVFYTLSFRRLSQEKRHQPTDSIHACPFCSYLVITFPKNPSGRCNWPFIYFFNIRLENHLRNACTSQGPLIVIIIIGHLHATSIHMHTR